MNDDNSYINDLLRERGRPSAEESERLALEAQFLAGRPMLGRKAESSTTIKLEPLRYRWWWESIIDWMMATPGGTLAECAKEIGCSKGYVYQLTQSDLFKERFRERVNAKNELLNAQLTERVAGAAISATALMQAQLDQDAKRPVGERKLNLETLSEVNDRLLRSLGYGVKGSGTTAAVQVNVSQQIETGADPGVLREAASRILEAREVAPEPPSAQQREAFELLLDEAEDEFPATFGRDEELDR